MAKKKEQQDTETGNESETGQPETETKAPRKARTTSLTPQKVLMEKIKKLNANQADYVARHVLKKHFEKAYEGGSDFEKELHEGIATALA